MVELMINSIIMGVFSSEKAAEEWCNKYHSHEGHQIFPLGTFLETDMEEKE